jgi:DNA-binding NarL/FixJ family response regulator
MAICPEIAEQMALDRLHDDGGRFDMLSPREFEVLRLLLAAKSADEIAAMLNVSRKTVLNYHYVIKSKLGVESDIELMLVGLRQGLVTVTQRE